MGEADARIEKTLSDLPQEIGNDEDTDKNTSDERDNYRLQLNAKLQGISSGSLKQSEFEGLLLKERAKLQYGNFESNPPPLPETSDRRRLTGSEVAASAPHRRLVVLEKLLEDIKS